MRFKFLNFVWIFLCGKLASVGLEMLNDGGVPEDGLQCHRLISMSRLAACHAKIGVSE